jgi:hypothetical protein
VIDSLRLTILKDLTALLQGITLANGYQHDLSTSVFRGRMSFSDDTALPCVSILEPLNPDREPLVTDQGMRQKDNWVLLIQGWVEDDHENPTDPAHLLMADVKKRLALAMQTDLSHIPNPLYMLGGKVVGVYVEPGTVRPADENSVRAFFFLRIVLQVVEHLDDPYLLD